RRGRRDERGGTGGWGRASPRHPTIGNREPGIGNRGGRPPPTAPHRRFFTAAPRCFIIPHSHDSRFPIADSQGRGGVGRPIPHSHDSRFPIPTGGVAWGELPGGRTAAAPAVTLPPTAPS